MTIETQQDSNSAAGGASLLTEMLGTRAHGQKGCPLCGGCGWTSPWLPCMCYRSVPENAIGQGSAACGASPAQTGCAATDETESQ